MVYIPCIKNRGLDFRPSISALLPLLPVEAHSVATLKHVMQKSQRLFLRSDQVTFVTVDQPLFAVAKQI